MKSVLYLQTILFVILSSCYKEIPFSEVKFEGAELSCEIAVSGFISNEKERCRIRLTKPVSVSEKIELIPIADASLILKKGENTWIFKYDSSGIYSTLDSISGSAGYTYILEINYHEKIYTAEEIMPYEPDDEFFLRFNFEPFKDENGKPIPFDENIGMTGVHTHNFGYSKTNVWGFRETCFYGDTLLNVNVYNLPLEIYTHKGSIPQGIFEPLSHVWLISHRSIATDSIEIIKGEISEGYNQYLLDVFNETDWQGGIFSTISGNVSTNLSEGAVGYFYALNVKRKRFMIKDMVDFK